MSEWQPIETAPKDGQFILLYGDCDGDGCAYFVGSYAPSGERGPFGRFVWKEQSGASIVAERAVTHWMPLPARPHARSAEPGET